MTAAAMPPNCDMRMDSAGEEPVPAAAVSMMPYTMDRANVHTPDTRNTSRKSFFVRIAWDEGARREVLSPSRRGCSA